MRFVLICIWSLIFSSSIFAQPDFSATRSGAWNVGTTWGGACASGCVSGVDFPGASDNAFTGGFNVTLPSGSFFVKDLFVAYNVANGITKGSLTTVTLTVHGQLLAYDKDIGELKTPITNVISTAGTFTLVFTGSDLASPELPVIDSWSALAPLKFLRFNPVLSTTTLYLNSVSIANSGSVTVFNGNLFLNSGELIRAASTSGSISVNAGTTLNVQGNINGDGTAASSFPTVTVNGTLTTGGSSYVNATTFTLGSAGILNVGFYGIDQTQGWWYQGNAPTALSIATTSTTNYTANASQNFYATTYGNLSLTSSSSVTKTLAGTGDLLVNESFNVPSTGVTLSATNINPWTFMGNFMMNGVFSAPRQVSFQGSAAQTISGTGTVNFGSGLQINKTAGSVSLSRAITISSGLSIVSGTLTQNTHTITLSGNLDNNGTLNSSAGTLAINGLSSIVGSSITTLNNLTISGTGNLTAPNGNLNIQGNFSNDGTFTNNSGLLTFNGLNDQIINGSTVTTFRDITITNTPGVVIVEGNENLRGVLTLAPDVSFDADGLSNNRIFTILSNADDPTQDGSIAALPATATLVGNVTVQRYMTIEGNDGTGAGRIYRYISSPVTGASVSDFQGEIPVTGSFTGASTCSGCLSTTQTMFRYNESIVTGGVNAGYEDFPLTANTETLIPGRGYTVYVRGNILSGGNARFDLRGSVTRGNQNFGVTFTSSGVLADDGWNLIGNPYPSPIDWNAAGWTKTNVSGTIHTRDNATSSFATFNGTTGTNGGTRYIATGQAFWVQTTSASPSLLAAESVKAPGQVTNFFRESKPADLIRITLIKGTSRDETVIHFREDATEKFDVNVDARKLKNNVLNVSTLSQDQVDLAINSQPSFGCGSTKVLKLKIADVSIGNYTFNFSEFESFPDYVGIEFHDNLTRNTIRVRDINNYSFDVTEDPASIGSDRFTLTFLPDAISVAVAPNLCEGTKEKPVIEIQKSKIGVSYGVMFNGVTVSETVKGTGQALSLSINRSLPSSGKNTLSLISTIDACGLMIAQPVNLTILNKFEITSTQATKACREGSVILQAVGTPEDGRYNWYENETGDALENHGSSLNTSVLTASRTYFVAAVSAEGCESSRVPVLAKVVQYEDALITMVGNNKLQSNYSNGNIWYFEGQKLSGITTDIFIPEKSGVYGLEVNIDGCSTASEFVFVITSSERGSNTGISVYPNPVEDRVFIDVLKSIGEVRKALIFNNIGSSFAEVEWVNEGDMNRGTIDMKNLPSGLYHLQITTSDRIENFKIYKK